jgi:hypothetical protein
MDNHEVLIDDRFDGSGLDETIEFMAPASPGGVKNGEDGSLPRGCLSLGSVKQGGGGPRRLRGGWTGRESGANGCGDCQAEGPASDHEPMIISAALDEQGARSSSDLTFKQLDRKRLFPCERLAKMPYW